MIVVECLYTSNEIEEETILREQQKRCLAAAASYGWAVRREVFEPLQLSARGMDDRTGIQTILDDVCNRRFDLLMIAKYYERIGDHATNIAEWVIYSVTGTHKDEITLT